jgi:hypothetical protein
MSMAGDIGNDSCTQVRHKIIRGRAATHLLREELIVIHLRDARELDHAAADLAEDAVRDLGHGLALRGRGRVELGGEVAEAAQLLGATVAEEGRERGRHPRVHAARAAGCGLDVGDRVRAEGLHGL